MEEHRVSHIHDNVNTGTLLIVNQQLMEKFDQWTLETKEKWK